MIRKPIIHKLRVDTLAYYDCLNLGMIKCKVSRTNDEEIWAVVTVDHELYKKGDIVRCDNHGGASMIVPRDACKRFNKHTGRFRIIENFIVEVK